MNYPHFWRAAMAIALGTGVAAPLHGATHRVQPGETLAAIARQHGCSLTALIGANRSMDPDRIVPGQEIELPSAKGKRDSRRAPEPPPTESRVVRKGENLTSIARRHGTSVDSLVKLNSLANADDLRAGQTILVPSSGSRAEPPARRDHPVVNLSPPESRSRRAPESGGIRYKVLRGETTSTIARKHGVSWGELARANRGIDPNHLAPGQIIHVPVKERPAARVAERAPARQASPPSRSSSAGTRVAAQAKRAPEPAPERPAARTVAQDDAANDLPPAAAEEEFELPESGAVSPPYGDEPPVRTVRNAVKVADGETLATIAEEFATTPEELRKLNGLTAFDSDPVPGSWIVIPQESMRAANVLAHSS